MVYLIEEAKKERGEQGHQSFFIDYQLLLIKGGKLQIKRGK